MHNVHDGEDCICSRCGGMGYEAWEEEDRRLVEDVCYHCGGTGLVDPRLDFSDRLYRVANTIAYQEESEYRKARNSGDDGFEEDYDFCAAENMMSAADYFKARVWEKEAMIAKELLQLPLETQEVLVAWNEYEG